MSGWALVAHPLLLKGPLGLFRSQEAAQMDVGAPTGTVWWAVCWAQRGAHQVCALSQLFRYLGPVFLRPLPSPGAQVLPWREGTQHGSPLPFTWWPGFQCLEADPHVK